MNVTFLKVKSNPEKIHRLCQAVQWHYVNQDTILLVTPNIQIAEYLNDLLWKNPQEGFIPHLISTDESKEKVVITYDMKNCNNANVIINLCPNGCTISPQPKILYEIMDQTEPMKEQVSMDKYKAYHKQGYPLRIG